MTTPDVGSLSAPTDESAAAAGRSFVSPIGSRRVEISISVATSVFGVLFTLQSVPVMLGHWPHIASPLGLALIVLVFGANALAGLSALLRQSTRAVFLGAASVYLLALALWPESIVRPFADTSMPWLLGLGNVAVGYLTIARRDWLVPLMYSVLTCALIGFLRTTPSAGAVGDRRALLDATYVFALDVALIVLVLGLRQAARSVDGAQNHALARYASAQVDQATEVERVAIDALVHDRVLTTFISAAKALTPENRELTVRMARSALAELSAAQNMPTGEGAAVPMTSLVERMRADAEDLGVRITVREQGITARQVPAPVAEAIASAAAQALVNSVRHGGGPDVFRALSIRGHETGGISALVLDRGAGFDLAAIPLERLGVRVSIIERMRTAGGEATIESAPGQGTRVLLEWPVTARSSAESWADGAEAALAAGELVE